MARTLSQESHRAILAAFLKLMERRRIEDITTEAIAREAGASKSTLYKHWPNKDSLLAEVIGKLLARLPAADSGNCREDAVRVLRNMFIPEKEGPFGRVWPKIFGYAASHPEFCSALNNGLIKSSPRHTLTTILRDAVASGELRANLDVGFAIDLLAGPLLHHRLLHGEVPSNLPEQVVGTFWEVLASRRRRRDVFRTARRQGGSAARGSRPTPRKETLAFKAPSARKPPA
jgi:AcrR family transcriptional regulator